MEELALVALHHPWEFAGYTLVAIVWGMVVGYRIKEMSK